MKQNELRLFNLVTWVDEDDPTNAILTVVGNNYPNEMWVEWEWADGLKDSTDCDMGSLKPIELTEDWLVKFGFIGQVRNQDSPNNRFMVWQLNILTYNTNHGWWYLGMQLQCEVKYVHQLQNLWFALTGEELTAEPARIPQL